MQRVVLVIYDWLRRYPAAMWALLCGIITVLLLPLAGITSREDITDFLPNGNSYLKKLEIFQRANSADKIFVLFSEREGVSGEAGAADDALCGAMDLFAERLSKADSTSLIKEILSEIDFDAYLSAADEIYRKIPYLITPKELKQADSLLNIPGAVGRGLSEARLQLMMPTGAMVAGRLAKDPLGLFSAIADSLGAANTPMADCIIYDGHILTPDGRDALCIITSQFNGNDSGANASLVELINGVAKECMAEDSHITISQIGGPVFTVTNASVIKRESIVALAVAALLIIVLLAFTIKNVRNIALIGVTLIFGWLCGLSATSLLQENISMIVIGIASIIVGIAANYPLHLITHLSETPNIRRTLRELVSPLITGNITTVGAFCALIPLSSVALRQLGLFAAAMLIGTILFTIIFLPHLVKVIPLKQQRMSCPEERGEAKWRTLHKSAKWYAAAAIAAITLIMGYFSLFIKFDSNLQNINYMTEEQRGVMGRLNSMMMQREGMEKIYISWAAESTEESLQRAESVIKAARERYEVSTIEYNAATSPSLAEQEKRLSAWREFTDKNRALLKDTLAREASKNDFSSSAFKEFEEIIGKSYKPEAFEAEQPLVVISVPAESAERVLEDLSQRFPKAIVFRTSELSSAIAERLSTDFNYIGLCCSLIVFIFLWISFRKFSYAIVAMLPMIISWIWILGAMVLLGIEFNLVNIILATFIFGQGDDYSIFITEGLLYEKRSGREILSSFRKGIFLSAAIMFIGMGVLVFASHPALHSLGAVTIVGMAAVVFFSCIIPPLVFSILGNLFRSSF